MILSQNNLGAAVIYGKVEKIKYGTGNAHDRLTIITLQDVDGFQKKEKSTKVLCWNSDHSKLSDKARHLLIGDLVSFRVEFDLGDPQKAVAFELKKSGLYRFSQKDGKLNYVLHGKIKKIVKSRSYTGAYITLNQYDKLTKNFKEVWYLAAFFQELEECLAKGDTIFLRFDKMESHNFHGFCYKEILNGVPHFVH